MYVIAPAVPVQAYRWEALKWLAFVAMVADHYAVFLLDGEFGVLREFGRLALPIFCITFGVGLSRTDEPFAIAWRLVTPAFWSQVLWLTFIGVDHLNILAVFLLCAVAFGIYRLRPGLGVVAFGVLLALGPWLEGAFFAPLLVAGGFLLASRGWFAPALVAGAGYAALSSSPAMAFLGALLPLLPQPRIPVPRIRGLLLWGYPGHLLVLGLLRSFA